MVYEAINDTSIKGFKQTFIISKDIFFIMWLNYVIFLHYTQEWLYLVNNLIKYKIKLGECKN